MKKSLFFYAAAALALTACTSEDDILQTGQTKQAAPQEVGFDVYTPAATNATRAGLVGTMTTGRLQRSEVDGGGFGVYAFLTEDENGNTGTSDANPNATSYKSSTAGANIPNFMVNEKILWNNTNLGWYYNPLKYWPNETDKDSQSSPASMEGTTPVHLDRLTFFAYAPYVTETAADGSGTGIIRITDKAGKMGTADTPDPMVSWKATTSDTDYNPNEGVDLLWGVAPAGGLSYTAVNGWTVTRNEGAPLLNMIKPDVNTSMKFLFQHALARVGINVVAAVDQVSPGGELDANTKITIESFKITGPFGTTGELNLNNDPHASVANWTKIGATYVTSSTTSLPATNSITVAANATNNAIAPNLRWTGPHGTPVEQPVVGVTTAKQDLLASSNKWYTKLSSKPAYNPAKQYFTESAGIYTEATATATITGSEGYYKLSGNNYNKQGAGTIDSPAFPEAVGTDYVTIAETSYPAGADPGIAVGTTKLYTKDGSDNYIYVCTYAELAADVTTAGGDWAAAGSSIYNPATTYYSIVTTTVPLASIAFTYPDGTYYQAERNYLYVVPTNAALNANFGNVTTNEKALRTITVQIEYYITTEDSKLNAGRAQTKNVITKEVVLPSLANGKTYMLNLVLGLTSVKIEAEVDDWKVINVQADLPQNTAE